LSLAFVNSIGGGFRCQQIPGEYPGTSIETPARTGLESVAFD
jgi:hypothetical protein